MENFIFLCSESRQIFKNFLVAHLCTIIIIVIVIIIIIIIIIIITITIIITIIIALFHVDTKNCKSKILIKIDPTPCKRLHAIQVKHY